MAEESCNSNCSACGDAGCASRQAPQKLAVHEGTKIDKIIAIASGKGGVGKSLTTALLACELRRRGHSVGILDGDITGPSIPRSFGIHEPPSVDESGMLAPAVTKTGIKIVSTNMLTSDEAQPFLWRGPVLNGILTQFYSDINWGELDYLLIDMPPGTGDVPLTVFQTLPVDGIIIVSSPQELVGMIVGKAVQMAEMMKIPILGIVENMSYVVCPDCGKHISVFGDSHVDETAARYKLPVLAKMPIDPELAKEADAGMIETYAGEYLDGAAKAVANLLK